MIKKQVVHCFNELQHYMQSIKETQNHLVRIFLAQFGVPKSDLNLFIEGNYQCVIYLPEKLRGDLPSNLEEMLPDSVLLYKSSPFSKEGIGIELHKIIEKVPSVRLYNVSISDFVLENAVEEWLQDRPKYVMGIDPYEQGSSGQPPDRVLAMVMALQHGAFKEEPDN